MGDTQRSLAARGLVDGSWCHLQPETVQLRRKLWRIVAIRPGGQVSLEGLLGVYVDDILVTARQGIDTRVVQELRRLWTTSEPERPL